MFFDDPHFSLIEKALRTGTLVPFLGAGVNLCERPDPLTWHPDQGQYLPSADDLRAHLAKAYNAPAGLCSDLMRVAQYIDVMAGTGALYEDLRTVFDQDFPPTIVHTFLARLPAALKPLRVSTKSGHTPPRFIIVTTNYDDVLERAFDDVDQPCHVLSYVTLDHDRGRFLHRRPGNHALYPIKQPNEYTGLLQDDLPVIVKIHGAVDRMNPSGDSFVITEDHYIDYLTRIDLANFLPIPIPERLVRSHILFLGYGLRDWNLRVFFHRIWGSERFERRFNAWAIQQQADDFEKKFWRTRNVEIIDVNLVEYIGHLHDHMGTWASRP